MRCDGHSARSRLSPSSTTCKRPTPDWGPAGRREAEHGGRWLIESNSNKPAVNEGFPMKEWTVEVYVLDQDGKEKPARCFTKAVYHLHPSFENPVQSTSPPLRWFGLGKDVCTDRLGSLHGAPFQVHQRGLG